MSAAGSFHQRVLKYNIELGNASTLVEGGRRAFDALAVKFMKREAVSVEMRGDQLVARTATARDHGLGIAPAALKQLGKNKFIVLVLPSADIITSEIDLPDEAVRSLPAALRYSLSTWTPFEHDEVYATARPIGEKTAGIQRVELRLALKDQVQQAIDGLASLGVSPDAIALGREDSLVDLATTKGRRLMVRRTAMMSLGTLFVLQLFGAAHMLSARQEAQIFAHQAFLTEEVKRNQERAALHNEIEKLEQAQRPPPIGVRLTPIVASFAEVFGEGIVVEEFDLQNGRGRATIISERAIDTVERMSKSQLFKPIDATAAPTATAGRHAYAISFTYAVPPREARP